MISTFLGQISFADNAASGNCLYSCGGEGTILIHSMNHLQNKARDMNSIIKKTNSIQVGHSLDAIQKYSWLFIELLQSISNSSIFRYVFINFQYTTHSSTSLRIQTLQAENIFRPNRARREGSGFLASSCVNIPFLVATTFIFFNFVPSLPPPPPPPQ